MITSTQNTRIKWIRALQSSSQERRQSGLFVVEGARLAEEALASTWQALQVIHTPDLSPRIQLIVGEFAQRGVPVDLVNEPVMRSAGDTGTPQGILVVLTQHPLPIQQPLDFAFLPDGIRDPGNLGTMLRTAAAAGVGAAFLPPGTVDVFSPKVVRAGMGAHFRLPILNLSWEEIRQRVSGLPVYLAATGAGIPYTQPDYRNPAVLVVGGEAQGASEQAQALSSALIQIPMPGGMESLNAAAAAAILLFEVVRQRQPA